MSLRAAYTLWAPIYDLAIAAVTRPARARSLETLATLDAPRVLLIGVGTGLDLPHLPTGREYVALDLTPAMLDRAVKRAQRLRLDMRFCIGDAMRLPFADTSFDAVVMHLILAVVPDPAHAFVAAGRVLRPGGHLLVFDKFLGTGQRAPLRRAISPLLARIATNTDVEFEPLLPLCPCFTVVRDEPALAGGWFRRIVLRKSG